RRYWSRVKSYKRTVDASNDWWESRLKVVPEAQKFRTSSIDLEFEGKLDQMFMGIVATGDKAWAPSSSTLCSHFFEDVDNEIPEENEEENEESSKQIGGVAKWSSQIEKLCNAIDKMNQATSILTPVMDPYDIPEAIKVLNGMSEEVPE
ncbi:hypothetical protein Golax_000743, partial [Gossypium laxum]|nr:hypothetical protein [Gossypium laxum]